MSTESQFKINNKLGVLDDQFSDIITKIVSDYGDYVCDLAQKQPSYQIYLNAIVNPNGCFNDKHQSLTNYLKSKYDMNDSNIFVYIFYSLSNYLKKKEDSDFWKSYYDSKIKKINSMT